MWTPNNAPGGCLLLVRCRLDSSPEDVVLTFSCPRCGQAQQDDYEVIDYWRARDWRCGSCNRVFSVLLTECHHCGSESPEIALVADEQVPFESILCHACGRACVNREEATEAIDSD